MSIHGSVLSLSLKLDERETKREALFGHVSPYL